MYIIDIYKKIAFARRRLGLKYCSVICNKRSFLDPTATNKIILVRKLRYLLVRKYFCILWNGSNWNFVKTKFFPFFDCQISKNYSDISKLSHLAGTVSETVSLNLSEHGLFQWKIFMHNSLVVTRNRYLILWSNKLLVLNLVKLHPKFSLIQKILKVCIFAVWDCRAIRNFVKFHQIKDVKHISGAHAATWWQKLAAIA